MSNTMLADARAEALFLSHLQPSHAPNPDQVKAAIRQSILEHHGVRGCACDVAAEFGDHPDTAPDRMLWARATIVAVYTNQGCGWTAHPLVKPLVGATL